MSHVFLSANPALLDIKDCFYFFANINTPVVGIFGAQKLCTFLIISLGTIASQKATISKGVYFSKVLANICGICIFPFLSSSNTTFLPTKDTEGPAVGIWRWDETLLEGLGKMNQRKCLAGPRETAK